MKFPNVIRSVFVLAFASAMHGQVVNPGGTGGGSGSGGSSGQYSTASVGYTVSAPYYFPPGGGLAASTTEAAVQGRVTIAGTIANFSASVSAAPGSNTITFTWRKATPPGASGDQTITCAITSTATTCADVTHTFTVAVGDLIDIKAVATTGTVTGAVVLQWGTPGLAGAAGAAGYSPKWIVGAGVPSSGTGNNSDMAINSTTGDVYGPKAAGAWGEIAANIKGATGSAGAAGSNGTNGSNGSNGAAGYSPNFIVAAGAPSSGTGNNGDMYVNSTTSDVYGPKAAGAWGSIAANIKGATGSAGAAGTGVPTGGTTGQVLTKNSNTNYDTGWGSGGSGSGIVTLVTQAGAPSGACTAPSGSNLALSFDTTAKLLYYCNASTPTWPAVSG